MSLIAEVIIPQMFTAYAEDKGYINVQGCSCGYGVQYSGLHHYQYFCEECDQVFSSAWGRVQGSLNYAERGSYFHCPHCGKTHRENVVYVKQKEITPNKVRLVVKAFDSVVTFEVYSNTVEFQDYLRLVGGTYKEIFRFDIAKQTVLFTVYDNGVKKETVEIGNPYKLELFSRSILRFFLPNSLANAQQKSELNRILKVLRETVHRKLEKRLGYKIPSMFVSPGQYHGTFLLPLLNISYRVACPDAPNLSTVYRSAPVNIKSYWKAKMLEGCTSDSMDDVMKLTRKKKSFVSAMATVHSLPDKPLVKKALGEDPFGVNLLRKAFDVCSNYDNAIKLYRALNKLWAHGPVSDEWLYKFLKNLIPIYGETGIIRLVEKASQWHLWDCMSLYNQLNTENQKAIKTEKVRLRDLHDWMSLRHRRQTHVNLKLDVPEHIVKRLSMQRNRLSFFLPKESIELLDAGEELNNCVASYGKAMKDNSIWIVLVADDNGKLVAALEVKGKELVQAKIYDNKPISQNAKLNAEVLAWAQKAGIKINTKDVDKETDKTLLRVALA